jgi:hypothetical protein
MESIAQLAWWCRYIGEDIQKTGVAIETRGFSIITSGKKRETLSGDASVMFYDWLRPITQVWFMHMCTEREVFITPI